MDNELYLEDINNTINAIKDIDKLRDKKIFITGSNGMIGSFIIDLIMYLNVYQLNYPIVEKINKYYR